MAQRRFVFTYLGEKRDKAVRKDRFISCFADGVVEKISPHNPTHYIYVNKNGSVSKVVFATLGPGKAPKDLVKGTYIYDRITGITFVYDDQYKKSVDQKLLDAIAEFSNIDKEIIPGDPASYKKIDEVIRQTPGSWEIVSAALYNFNTRLTGTIVLASSDIVKRRIATKSGSGLRDWNLYTDGNLLDKTNRLYINYADRNSGGGDPMSRFFGMWFNARNGYAAAEYNPNDQ